MLLTSVFALTSQDVITAVKRTFRQTLSQSELQQLVCQSQPSNQPPQSQPSGTGTNCVNTWSQCGGIGYSGATCCNSGTCKVLNPWYSQCIPGTPTPTPTPSPVTPPQSQPSGTGTGTNCVNTWSQCGGIGYSGATCCNSGTCKVLNPWYSQCIPGTPIPTPVTPSNQPPQSNPPSVSGQIPITSGNTATLTYFDDNQVQCYSQIPSGNGCAVNPLLLGFTESQWNNQYAYASPNQIPWCGKSLTLTVNGKSFTCTIIDTCNPVAGQQFQSGNQIIGGQCDYPNVIDLYGDTGRNFLESTVGDDFYQGNVQWTIV